MTKPRLNTTTGTSVLCLALCVAVSPAVAKPKTLDRIVAVVENEAITERQLGNSIRRAQAMLAQQKREIPDKRALAAQVLQQMIVQQLQLQEAKRLGIVIDDITVDLAVENMAKRNNLSLAELKAKVESGNESFAALRRKIRDDLTIQRLMQREVVNRIEVSKQEIDDLLMRDNPQKLGSEYRFTHIRVQPPESADARAAAKRRLARIQSQLRGDSFSSLDDLRDRLAQLWRAAAEDKIGKLPYRVNDLGWRRAEDLPAPIRRRIDSLRDTGTSPVIANDKGLHLFQLLTTRSNSPEMMQLQYHVRHILIQTNPIDDDATVRRKLVRIKHQIKDNGADFGALACQHSEDPLSSMKGGDLGWSTPSGYVPEFAEAVSRARGKGDLVGPFKTSFGWHILEVLGTREHDVGDDTMRQQAIAEIRKSKSNEEIRLWLLRLRENRRVEVRL